MTNRKNSTKLNWEKAHTTTWNQTKSSHMEKCLERFRSLIVITIGTTKKYNQLSITTLNHKGHIKEDSINEL
jgi:hypothetical protein